MIRIVWEHWTWRLRGDGGRDDDEALDRAGADGWELVAVCESDGQHVAYFKRAKSLEAK